MSSSIWTINQLFLRVNFCLPFLLLLNSFTSLLLLHLLRLRIVIICIPSLLSCRLVLSRRIFFCFYPVLFTFAEFSIVRHNFSSELERNPRWLRRIWKQKLCKLLLSYVSQSRCRKNKFVKKGITKLWQLTFYAP